MILATLENKKQLTPKIIELDLKPTRPQKINFEAGQFVLLEVPQKSGAVTRPYSIASNPKQNKFFSFCVGIFPGGKGSEYVRNLKIGDKLKMGDPLGFFTISKNDYDNDFLFVAAGTGIAPFKSIIPQMLEQGFDNKIILLFGLRSEEDIFYFDFFRNLSAQHKNFKFIPTLSQPKKGWQGIKGRVTDFIANNKLPYKKFKIYACGSPQMTNDVSELLISKGVNPKNLMLEIF